MINDSVDRSWLKLLAVSGIFSLAAFAMVLVACPSGFSFFMDDITFLHRYQHVDDILGLWQSDVASYWKQGRFFPLTFLLNILKYHCVPANPGVFRIFNTALFLAGVGLGSWRIVKQYPDATPRRWPIVFLLGFAVLHRPLLDIAAINSISEGWVVLFFAAGLILIDADPFSYRLAFAACALSKEPAILAFFASGGLHLWRSRSRGKSAMINGCVDLAIFAALAVLIQKSKSSGAYLENYSLFGMANIKQFAIGLVKCGIGLIPVAVLFICSWRSDRVKARALLRKILTNDAVILCALFGVPYLYLAASWSVAGYLLIPPSFCFFVIGGVAILEILSSEHAACRAPTVFFVALAIFLSISLYRFDRATRAIHEPLIALKTLFLTPSPRLIILQGPEPVIQGNLIVKESNANVVLQQYQAGNADGIAEFPGDVVLFEASSYFGRYPDAEIEAIGAKAGGWTRRVDGDVYRLFYALHDRK